MGDASRVGDDMSKVYQLAYEQLCESYHQISTFRAQLLALQPIVSGAARVAL